MGTMTIRDSNGNPLYQVTTDGSGDVLSVKKDPNAKNTPVDPKEIENLLKGQHADPSWTLDTILTKLGMATNGVDESDIPVYSKDLSKRAQALDQAIDQLKGQAAAATGPKKASIESEISLAQAMLKQVLGQMKSIDSKTGFDTHAKTEMENLSAKYGGDPTLGAGKAAAPSAAGGSTPTTPGSAAAPGAAATPSSGMFPGAGKAMGVPGQLDLQSMLMASRFADINMTSMDQLGKTQMDQKKMMMLFMYFAQMAMSGDVGAMTAFMQFITTIITKDKAQLNINMANKMIELEDANRKAVDQLTSTPAYDANNPQVGVDFEKQMEKTKADEGEIATSQKLISQMMEDFSQVSEFLNNLQKSMLDVRGRLLSRLSTFNA